MGENRIISMSGELTAFIVNEEGKTVRMATEEEAREAMENMPSRLRDAWYSEKQKKKKKKKKKTRGK